MTKHNHHTTPRFANLRNLFTLRSLAILSITLVLSFAVRWYIVHYFNYDLSQFKDFFLIGLLVSLIRPLITDVIDMYYPITTGISCVGDVTVLRDNMHLNRDNCGSHRGSARYNSLNNANSAIDINSSDKVDIKSKFKRKLL